MADAIWQRTTRHPSVTLASQEAHHSAAFWFRRAQILTAVPFDFMLRTSPGNVLKSKFERNAKAGLGPYREAAMALTFEPERIVYDTEEELLRFFATDDVLLIRCAVSKATLAALEDSALTDHDAIVIAYHRNRELIRDIAERKYRAHQFETGGIVVVRIQDLPM